MDHSSFFIYNVWGFNSCNDMDSVNKVIVYSIIVAIVLTSIFSVYQIYLKSSYVNSQGLPESSIDYLKSIERDMRVSKTLSFLPLYLITSFMISFLIISFFSPKYKKVKV